MKVGQKSIVRWVAKLLVKESGRAQRKSSGELQTLSADQLRQVSGGVGESNGTPTKGW